MHERFMKCKWELKIYQVLCFYVLLLSSHKKVKHSSVLIAHSYFRVVAVKCCNSRGTGPKLSWVTGLETNMWLQWLWRSFDLSHTTQNDKLQLWVTQQLFNFLLSMRSCTVCLPMAKYFICVLLKWLGNVTFVQPFLIQSCLYME